MAGGAAQQAQFLRIGKGGRRLWLQAVYTPILDRAGRTTKVIKFATDITAQKSEIANLEGQLAAIDKGQAVIEFDLRVGLEKASTISIPCETPGEQADVGDGYPGFC